MNASKTPAGQQVCSCRHSLTRLRTHWAIGVTTAAVVLGAAAVYLVAWVSGFVQQSRLLLVVLFLVVTVVAATAWAMTALSDRALNRDALEVSTETGQARTAGAVLRSARPNYRPHQPAESIDFTQMGCRQGNSERRASL